MDEHHILADPHGLLQSGEELATVPELARLFGCSSKALRSLVHGPLYERVRFVRYKDGPTRYCVADARAAVGPYAEALEARRRCAAELEACERGAKAVKVAATAAKHQVRLAAKVSQSRRQGR
jgi:hypothetical protein